MTNDQAARRSPTTGWLFLVTSILAFIDITGAGQGQPANGGDTEEKPEGFEERVTVTATRIPVKQGESGRHVEVLTADEIEAHGVRGIPELLQLFPGLDVRRRGVNGVQADLSIRGSSFEQVLVLVDGVPVNNPQTGHHTLDLPVPVAAIERVEVLYGPGSALHGANAAGGVVQIFTKTGTARAARLGGYFGDHGLLGFTGDVEWARSSAHRHSISLERSASDGHQPGTEFDLGAGWYRGSFGGLDLTAGASARDFGAKNFYTTRFPDQVESTAARFLSLGWAGAVRRNTLRAKAAVRRHEDVFVLDRFDPGLLTNEHEDGGIDLQFTVDRSVPGGALQTGIAWIGEQLESTNLGDRNRSRWGLFASHVGERARWTWRVAASADRVEDDWEVHPALAVSRRITHGQLRAAVASAYRLPSFTELYYTSPATAGNPDLRPEQSWTYELGYSWIRDRGRVSLTAFARRGRDLIDFVLAPEDVTYRASNLRAVNTEGVELVAARRFDRASGNGGLTATVSYTYLDSSGDEPAGRSAYVFDYLEDRALVRLESWGRRPLSWAATACYNARAEGDSYTVLDARLAHAFRRGPVTVFLRGANLTDERYVERSAVEMPGRWIMAGAEFSLDW